jgi:hypothetical protein
MNTITRKIILPKIKLSQDDKIAKIYPEIEYKLQFDGCSKSNPGIAGAGAVIYKFNEEISSKIQFVGNNATNNAAEYTGLVIGLKEAIKLAIKINKTPSSGCSGLNKTSIKNKFNPIFTPIEAN